MICGMRASNLSISKAGVCLATDTGQSTAGHLFLIETHLPRRRGVSEGTSEAVWLNQIEAKDYPKGMGVKSLDLSEGERARLEGYLDELRTKVRA